MKNRLGSDPRPDDLDPLAEPDRWESLVGRIGEQAEPYLAERRGQPAGLLDIVARWARPTLATAASLLLLATAAGIARTVSESQSVAATSEAALAEAVMPTTFAAWVAGVSEPSVTEMVRDLETYGEVDR